MKWEVQGWGVVPVESRVTDMKCLATLGRRVLKVCAQGCDDGALQGTLRLGTQRTWVQL